MKTVRLGIIGFGGRGGHLGQTAHMVSGGVMQPVAAFDPHDEGFEKGCSRWGYRPTRYASIAEMLAKEPLDALIIGSPNEFHLANLLEVESAGLPLLLEKPLDAGWTQINDVVRFAWRYPAPIMVGHCLRYAPILQKARELIKQGAIGRVCSARFLHYCHYGDSMWHGWYREKTRSGSMMITKATHDIDIMQSLLSARPVSVYASLKQMVFGGEKSPELRCRDCEERFTCRESTTNIVQRRFETIGYDELKTMNDLCVYSSAADIPDDEICLMQFDSGIHALYTEVFYSPMRFHHRDYQILGDEGAMDIDVGTYTGKILLAPRFGSNDDAAEYHFDYMTRNHCNSDGPMLRHFYEVVTGKAQPQTTVEQAYFAEALGYCAMESAEQGAVVDIRSRIPQDLGNLWRQPLFPDESRGSLHADNAIR